MQQLRLLIGQKIYRDLGLTYYHVYYPGDIQVSGKPQKNIVGYDKDTAYVFAESKKKPLNGNDELRNNMVLSADVCADFAVAVSEPKRENHFSNIFQNKDSLKF